MPSIAKITEILDLLRENFKSGLSSKEISITLKIPQSTCYRIMSNLKTHGYVQQRPHDARYILGYAHLRYAQALLQGFDENQLIDPFLEQLHKITNRTTVYSRLNGEICVAMDVRGAVDTRVAIGIGEVMPFNCSAAGKAVLAFMPQRKKEEILSKMELIKKTPATISSMELLRDNLDAIRESGVAYNLGEMNKGINSMASPIFNARNDIFGAIAIVSTAEDLPIKTLQRYSMTFVKAGKEITKKLGGEYPHWI